MKKCRVRGLLSVHGVFVAIGIACFTVLPLQLSRSSKTSAAAGGWRADDAVTRLARGMDPVILEPVRPVSDVSVSGQLGSQCGLMGITAVLIPAGVLLLQICGPRRRSC